MTQVNPTLVTPGTRPQSANVNTPVQELANIINGNLDDGNLKAGAGINGSKLADATVTPAKMSSIKLNGVGGAYSGTPPAANGTFQLQAGTTVVNTDVNGNANFSWPTAFTNGVLTVILTEGDANSGNYAVSGIASVTNTTGLALHVGSGTGSAGAGAFRINYIAIGW